MTEEPLPYKAKLIQRIQEALDVLQTAKIEAEQIESDDTAMNLLGIAAAYFNQTPSAVAGKSMLQSRNDIFLFNILVAAYFCKSGNLLLKKKEKEGDSPLVFPGA
jgi:hypothetical protein